MEDAEFYQEDTDKQELKDFLRDLTKLSKRTGITIGGCGCCGSPFLVHDGAALDDLYWDDEAKKYIID